MNAAGYVNPNYQLAGSPPPLQYVPTPPLAQSRPPIHKKVNRMFGNLLKRVKSIEREGIRDYEIYSEVSGACKHCFDQDPTQAPRMHKPGHKHTHSHSHVSHTHHPSRVEKTYKKTSGRRSSSGSTISDSGTERTKYYKRREQEKLEKTDPRYKASGSGGSPKKKKVGVVDAAEDFAINAWQANVKFWTEKGELPPRRYTSSPEDFTGGPSKSKETGPGEGPSRRDSGLINEPAKPAPKYYNPNLNSKGEFRPYFYDGTQPPRHSETSSTSSLAQTRDGKSNFLKNFFADPPPRLPGYYDQGKGPAGPGNKGEIQFEMSTSEDGEGLAGRRSPSQESSSSESGLFGLKLFKNRGKKPEDTESSVVTSGVSSRPGYTRRGHGRMPSESSSSSNPGEYDGNYSSSAASSVYGGKAWRRYGGQRRPGSRPLSRKTSMNSVKNGGHRVPSGAVGKPRRDMSGSPEKKSWFTKALETLATNPQYSNYSSDSSSEVSSGGTRYRRRSRRTSVASSAIGL